MKNLLTRRSIRKYADKEVSEELLGRLLNEAARTQTMGNLQLYSVVVTRLSELFVAINHKETLAQVFTDIRYTRKDNEALSQSLIDTLKRQGFM